MMNENVVEKKADIKERSSNFELLRILMMFMIIVAHLPGNNIGNFYEVPAFNSFILYFTCLFGGIGCNIFMMVTGYFMCKGKFKLKKVILFILQVELYSWISFWILSLSGHAKFLDPADCFPILGERIWYASYYLLIYILSPYINKLIDSMSKEQFKHLIIILLIVYTIIPTAIGWILPRFYETSFGYNHLIWALMMYLVGAYLRINPPKIFKKQSFNIVSLISITVIIIIYIILYIKNTKLFDSYNLQERNYFSNWSNIFMIWFSVSVFNIFANLKLKHSKVINAIASTTFGIYILHTSKAFYFLCSYPINDVFNMRERIYGGENAIFVILQASIIVFVVCMCIEFVRKLLEKLTIKKFLDSKIK